jgi:hypothetical protein
MNYVMIAVSWVLFAQPASEPGTFEPIPLQAKQAAPPAGLDNVPAPTPVPGNQPVAVPGNQPVAVPGDQPVDVPGDLAPAGDASQDPRAADGSLERPDPDRSTEDRVPGAMEPLEARPQQKLRPPELIAEALENPKQEALDGTPISMSQALGRARDRGQQLGIAQSYWKLAAAQAEYHWALKLRVVLSDYTQPHTNLAGALGAQAAAEADVRDAQLRVKQAQQQLADLLGPGSAGDLPLTIDRPHVGDYRTYYETIFGSRAPPPRMRLIHRTLPVRRKAIDAHAEAIVAASDAVNASGEQFRASGQGLSTFLGSIDLLKRERRAFVAEVRDYNLDIAEYAFAVAPADVQSDTLVSMLIRTSPPAASPTRAPGENAAPSTRKTLRKPLPDKTDSADDPDDWTSNYPNDPNASAVDDPGMYQALLAVTRHPLRVQKLANLLHWDRNLPPESGQPVALAECLRGVPAQDRLAVIHAYWQARECAARFQVLTELQEQLNALQSIAIPQRDQPGMAEAGVRLQAARRSARAAILDAQLALVAAQFELTQVSGRPLADSWLLPSTPPQSGRYVVAKRSRRGAHWADVTTLEYDKLRHRADAVIQSDAHRADLVLKARRNETGASAADDHMTPLDRVIWATQQQNEHTLAFLDDLTQYNMAIANYALITLPPSLSGDELAGKLAIARSTLRDS